MSQIAKKQHLYSKTIMNKLKNKTMETKDQNALEERFAQFILESEDMINVRGGDNDEDPYFRQSVPPVL